MLPIFRLYTGMLSRSCNSKELVRTPDLRQVPRLQHANAAVDETRRADFFRKGGRLRGLVRGKRWLPLTRWHHLKRDERQTLQALFAVNRRFRVA